MSAQDYDYGDDFVEVKRGGYAGYHYGSEQENDLDYLASAPTHRDRSDSMNLTPSGFYGDPTHSEAEDPSSDEPAYFSTKHQFESSFRSVRGRERAPLEPRVWDMRNAMAESDYTEQRNISYDENVEMHRLSPELQELAIIEDILSLMMRVSGRYISFSYSINSNVWRRPMAVEQALVAPSWINPTLAQMTNKILPIVLLHMRIDQFVIVYARRNAGVINQALCAAIRALLKDYYVLISQLEHRLRTATASKPFTLQQLWFHISPTLQVFERLVQLINEIQAKDLPQVKKEAIESTPREDDGFTTLADKRSNLGSEAGMDDVAHESGLSDDEYDEYDRGNEMFVVRGGYTLNVISDMIKLRGGDASTRQLYEFLLSRATVPFLQMLRHWLHTGDLEDSKPDSPGGEFMVASDSNAVGARSFIGGDVVDLDDGIKPVAKPHQHLGFVSVPELTPAFLHPYATKIVRTGEYLNILRACGVDLRSLDTPDIKSLSLESPASPSQQQEHSVAGAADHNGSLDGLLNQQMLVREIDQAYLRANQALLNILFKDDRIMSYMGAVKHYLLFEKSDFLTHFLDLAKFEMNRQPKDMSANRLQSFLELALLNPASVSHDDPLKDIVQVTLESVDLIDTLKTINMGDHGETPFAMQRTSRDSQGGTFFGTSIVSDNFLTGDLFIALQLQIPFPLSIVLDKVAMNKYKALSRLLLALKQTEQNLVSSWIINLKLEEPRVRPDSSPGEQYQSGKEARVEELRRYIFLRIHTMRHRMLISIQQILYYCFWDVIEPQWLKMTELMRGAKTVDELSKIHMQYLDLMFQQCGLTAPKLPKIIVELLKRANRFTGTVSKLISSKSTLFRGASASGKSTVSGKLLDEINSGSADWDAQHAHLASVAEKLKLLDKYWVEQLKILLKALNHYARKFEESYLNLAVRLDCNKGDDDVGQR
ncbi:hypothetical protein GQ54DRAFT_295009 [Martensiomyces pterosporus]|nr:hypothetical protein GQ54DRAFT_295009 [Martensiomyces pterosporus]